MKLILGKKFDLSKNNSSLYTSLSEWQHDQLSEAESESEVECLLRTWYNNSYKDAVPGSFCDGFWDSVYCWPPIKAGRVITRMCSEILPKIYTQVPKTLNGKVELKCLDNGTWTHGSRPAYDECIEILEDHLETIKEDNILSTIVQHTSFFGSAASLLCLLISLGIFYSYRCLHCDRLTVQVHLILSLILRLSLMFVIAEPLVIGHQQSYRDVEVLCKTVLIFYLYSTFTTVSWMFIQGLYLNITLMIIGNGVGRSCQYMKLYNLIGWVVPACFVIAYVITMGVKNQEKCWQGYSEMDEIWILLGPIIFELVLNGLFLCNILRILLRKIRNSNCRSDTSQIKTAAKATAMLFPVLGINNLFLLYNPGGHYNKYFVIMNTFFGSTQGVFVAIVYCFTNKEVLAAIRRSLQRANARRIENLNQNQTNDRLEILFMLTQQLNGPTSLCHNIIMGETL